ncbi:Stk1 family PASTA domain-containing Ser/Thr kinase [Allobaculum stercoricanis]|uniref:Stk1 family PASTA domain-containing Ser/Thr kinase n=1 Tax=Allobaculum stercoricanis TaxID=174709 RepID=UPI0029427308|nr:Stk1 family PASTA domain-containing Ser/Thr kinase [Allobaculum stercoricanis]
MLDTIANRYHIKSLIGQGGMADVYLAYDEIMNRPVAIKILRPKVADDSQAVVRFIREASAVRKLSHPNVVEVYDVGECGNLHYLVMEYIPGITLKELIAKSGKMSAPKAILMMKELTSAVAAAHKNNIIHRDIKPQNVLIHKNGQLKITDFGIAIAADSMDMTANQAIMGSSHYLAPESAVGLAPDYRVDIYALGIVFFELLCGSVPFTGTSPAAIALKHMQDPLPSILPYNETVTQAIENVVIKATAKNPDERYQSAQELLDALETCQNPEFKNVKKLELKTPSLELPAKDESVVTTSDITQTSTQRPLSHVSKEKTPTWPITALTGLIGILVCAFSGLMLISSGVVAIDGWFGWQQVPNVAGLSQEDALNKLTESGILANQIEIQEVAVDQYEPGIASGTDIPAGHFVSNEDKISLYIAKGPTFLVGDYTGQYLEDVQKIFTDNNLSIWITTTTKETVDRAPGVILEQHGLLAGTRIDPKDQANIEFVVSAYPTIMISDRYIGMDVDQAKQELNDLGMAVITKNIQGSKTVQSIDPPVGTNYTQEGSDSVITLYH